MTDIDDLALRLEALEAAVGELRQLVQRAYEQTPAAAARLLELRREPTYALAYAPDALVTVRIGTYHGRELLLERALASVRRQTYPNWEAVIVADGREPETARRIAELGDERIRYRERPRNGPYPTDPDRRWSVAGTHPFNEAVAHAGGRWIAPLDQDDEWTDDHLEQLLGAAVESGAEVVYGVGRVPLGAHGETYFGTWPPRLGDFGFQTAIYHAHLATFLYDINAHLLGEPGDWNLARRLLEAGARFEFLDRVVCTYFADGASSDDWWLRRLAERGAHLTAEGVG